ncbi:uroporphyrinogen-III synthase [Nesterenkonia ebinurensis]|uniref:uroporphyrinogen-III synthase n=1 Tax=Nesterenkonia ebinurensis TaxID=2608252 RepID=UPI00168A6A19|nr:uroporphyrinogen-III synthase [Nesterenkonia ebinurensis]
MTRHPAQTGALEDRLRDAGFDVAFLPLTQQVLPEDLSELTTTIQRLERGDFHWLLLTSGNTVRALRDCGWDGTVPERTQVGVVGSGTARVLNELSEAHHPWMPQDHSAAGVLAELPTPAEGSRLLLLQSAKARPELAEGLTTDGWSVTRVTAYDTVPLDPAAPETLQPIHITGGDSGDLLTPRDLAEGDIVLITSSSAARVWAQLSAPPVTTLAMGQPTAEALTSLGRLPDSVLPEPTAVGVLRALGSS